MKENENNLIIIIIIIINLMKVIMSKKIQCENERK